MNIEELMVGNWVMAKGIPAKVEDMSVTLTCKLVMVEDSWVTFSDQDIQPIPLTGEILESNGFHKRTRYKIDIYRRVISIVDSQNNMTVSRTQVVEFYRDIAGGIVINCRIRGRKRKFEGVITSVNELQNAFAVCGLLELANNFKIHEQRSNI